MHQRRAAAGAGAEKSQPTTLSAAMRTLRSVSLAGSAPALQRAPLKVPTLAVMSESRHGTLTVAVPWGPVVAEPTTTLGGLQSDVQVGVEPCLTVIGTFRAGEPSSVTVTFRLIDARIGVGAG